MTQSVTLETHAALHWIVVFASYNAGLLVNVLTVAFASILSKSNGIHDVKTYFQLRWIPLLSRWFICVMMFFIIWENPSIGNFEKYMTSFPAHIGVAGFFGFTSDILWDRLLGLIAPGIHKSLPAIPPAVPDATQPNTPA